MMAAGGDVVVMHREAKGIGVATLRILSSSGWPVSIFRVHATVQTPFSQDPVTSLLSAADPLAMARLA